MAKVIGELAVVLLTMIFAAVLLKREPARARKTFAVSFVLAFAVSIAFTLAQLGAQLQLLDVALAYTPLDVLTLLAVIYWCSAACAKGALFDGVEGE